MLHCSESRWYGSNLEFVIPVVVYLIKRKKTGKMVLSQNLFWTYPIILFQNKCSNCWTYLNIIIIFSFFKIIFVTIAAEDWCTIDLITNALTSDSKVWTETCCNRYCKIETIITADWTFEYLNDVVIYQPPIACQIESYNAV